MENRDEFFNKLGGQLGADFVRRADPVAASRITWVLLAMLAFVGEEAVQVLFRKNFGPGGLSALRVIVCFILFEIIAVIFFLFGAFADKSLDVVGTHASFICAGIFYVVLGFVVLMKGLKGIAKAKNSDRPYKFAGESAMLSFLVKDGWSQSKTQNLAEPVLTLAIGIFFSFVNILWGIPVIYCALSVWACKVMDAIFLDPQEPPTTNWQQQGRDSADFN